MKKNLHFVLALTLGLATTVSAQDWSVDSRTRVNSAEIGTEKSQFNENLTRIGVAFGNENVGVVFSSDFYTVLGSDFSAPVMEFNNGLTFVHEAYVHSNVMDFAHVKAGRMALNYGSGRILGSNDWDLNGNTWDGALVGINNDFGDLHFGFASASSEDEGLFEVKGTQMFANFAKSMDAMSINATYLQDTYTETGYEDLELTAMGLDASYKMNNGATLTLGYYTAETSGLEENVEMDLTALGVHYPVNEDLGVHAGYDMYGEDGFYLPSGSFGDGLGSGMIYSSFAGFEGTDVSFGGTYSMGNFDLGATMHNIKSEDDATEYSVMDVSLAYSLSDNSSVRVNYATNDMLEDMDIDATQTWITLHVGF